MSSETCDLKQTVTRVTIEGEHTCVLVCRSNKIELFPILNAPHQTSQITIPYSQILMVRTYRYLQRDTCFRIVNNTYEEYLIECKSKKHFEKCFKIIQSKVPKQDKLEIGHYQTLWQNGLITNCEYLTAVNFYANRSFNDATQYPIFPWVISNYKQDPTV